MYFFPPSRSYFVLLITLGFFIPRPAVGQKESLRAKLEQIERASGGRLGVAIESLDGGDSLSLHGHEHFPMQSTFKLPLAMAILNQVDQGRMSLTQKVHLRKRDLLPNTISPMRDKYPHGNVDLTLREVLSYCVSYSDNNACDVLFRLIGGPSVVQKYVRSLGVQQIAIVANEESMHKSWKTQFTNWCEPLAMAKILRAFYSRKFLSPTSSDLLLQLMTNSFNPATRIKGLLPEGTLVAHKTGSSGTNKEGMAAATNDVGIVTLPNGKHFSIVVFLSMSKSDGAVRDESIAKVARAAWDYYLKQS